MLRERQADQPAKAGRLYGSARGFCSLTRCKAQALWLPRKERQVYLMIFCMLSQVSQLFPVNEAAAASHRKFSAFAFALKISEPFTRPGFLLAC